MIPFWVQRIFTRHQRALCHTSRSAEEAGTGGCVSPAAMLSAKLSFFIPANCLSYRRYQECHLERIRFAGKRIHDGCRQCQQDEYKNASNSSSTSWSSSACFRLMVTFSWCGSISAISRVIEQASNAAMLSQGILHHRTDGREQQAYGSGARDYVIAKIENAIMTPSSRRLEERVSMEAMIQKRRIEIVMSMILFSERYSAQKPRKVGGCQCSG